MSSWVSGMTGLGSSFGLLRPQGKTLRPGRGIGTGKDESWNMEHGTIICSPLFTSAVSYADIFQPVMVMPYLECFPHSLVKP